MNWSTLTDGNISAFDPENQRAQYGQFSWSTSVFLTVLMTLLVFATVFGNALVILAFVVEKSLRTQGNIFFLNLAIADFLVGGFCIPVYIPYVLTGEWRLGRGVCTLWLVMDYLLCTASVFNIVLISFDRFQSVTGAMNDRGQKGMTREALLKMACVWLTAFLLYGPAIISWEHIAGGSVVPDRACYAEFYYNWYFLMTASTVEFFTPFISVTYFNISIYMNIRKRNLMREGETGGAGHTDCGMELQGMVRSKKQQVFFVRPAVAGKVEEAGNSRGSRLQCTKALAGGSRKTRDSGLLDLPPFQLEDLVQRPVDVHYRTVEQSYSPRHSRPNAASASMATCFRLSRDKKVAKTLAVIVCVFGLCWAPYTLLMIIRAACYGQCVQHYLYEFSFWLLWINSSINPVLYPLCHTSFKRAFIKMLCPTKIKVQPQYMEHKC